MPYYLGIDAGGTKTAAVITDAAGTELGRGVGGSGNIAQNDDVSLALALRESVNGACEAASLPAGEIAFEGICAGVAGFSVEPRRIAFDALLRSLLRAAHYEVLPDYEVAYWGASEGEPSITVIAGTGAVAFGRNAAGQTHKEDGLGFLLGDKGSGFNLGLYALRHTLDRLQHNKTDELTMALTNYTQSETASDVIHWLYGDFSPSKVAAIAPIVGALSEVGDPAACRLVVEMARRLRHSVRKVRHHLWLPREIPIYTIGGLWELGAFFRREFEQPLWTGVGDLKVEPEAIPGGHFNLQIPRHDPAFGAAMRGRNATPR